MFPPCERRSLRTRLQKEKKRSPDDARFFIPKLSRAAESVKDIRSDISLNAPTTIAEGKRRRDATRNNSSIGECKSPSTTAPHTHTHTQNVFTEKIRNKKLTDKDGSGRYYKISFVIRSLFARTLFQHLLTTSRTTIYRFGSATLQVAPPPARART